jgi:secreted PhoX family phosphatase
MSRQAHEASDDRPLNPSAAATLGDLIQARFSRRDLLRGALAASALGGLAAGPLALLADTLTAPEGEREATKTGFDFEEIARGVDETHHVAPGYRAEVLIRWGDPVVPGAPAFDPERQSAAAQTRQFGYNNDDVGFVPLPLGSKGSEHGLLCVNEDVEPNPHNGRVYVMLTNNSKRGSEGAPGADAANPRARNLWGHILEITPDQGDHAAPAARWEVLIKAGDPRDPAVAALWNPATSANGWFACPDNCSVDPQGRLWVATDQGGGWHKASGSADGLWSLGTEGARRGTGRLFFRAPVGAEVCGPRFTPDGRTLFLAVQHPGTDGTEDYPPFARRSTFEDPATRWPDFDPALPPRPSVVVVTREDGGVIGG